MTHRTRVVLVELLAVLLLVAAGVLGVWLARPGDAPSRAADADDRIVPINPQPMVIPEEVKRLRVHGEAAVAIAVNEDGTVREVTLVRPGHPLVNEALIAAAKRTRFRMPASTKRSKRARLVTAWTY